jgi:hypothetical protein
VGNVVALELEGGMEVFREEEESKEGRQFSPILSSSFHSLQLMMGLDELYKLMWE